MVTNIRKQEVIWVRQILWHTQCSQRPCTLIGELLASIPFFLRPCLQWGAVAEVPLYHIQQKKHHMANVCYYAEKHFSAVQN